MIPDLDEEYVSSESEAEEDIVGSDEYALDPENAPSAKDRDKSIWEKELEFQLRKRTLIIAELRRAYLRDVVSIKYVVDTVLEQGERRKVFDDWKDSVPSADLKEPLLLRSPYLGALTVEPCKKCGGTIGIQFSDIQKVKDLTTKVETLHSRNELLRLMIAKQAAQLEKLNGNAGSELKNHTDEKKYLYGEIKRLKSEMEDTAIRARNIQELNKRMKEENLKHINSHQDLTIRTLTNEKALERAIELNTELKLTIANLREEVHAYQTGEVTLEVKISQLEDSLKLKDEELRRRNAVIEDLRSDLNELKMQIEKQREISKNAENTADLADRAKEALSEENRKLQVTLEKQLQANEVLEDKVLSLREELRDVTADLDASRSVVTTVKFERDIQRSLVIGLEAVVEEKTRLNDDLSNALEELQRKKLEELTALSDEFALREIELIKNSDDYRERDESSTRQLEELSLPATEVLEISTSVAQPRSDVINSNEDGIQSVSFVLKGRDSPSYRKQSPNASKDLDVFPVAGTSLSSTVIDPVADNVENNHVASQVRYAPVNKKPAASRVVEQKKAYRKVEHVMLLSALNPDSVEEASFREAVLALLTDVLDDVQAKKSLNALTPLLGAKARLLETTLQAVSDVISTERIALSSQEELRVFLSGAVDCIALENTITPGDVDAVLSRIFATASPQIQSSVLQDPDIVKDTAVEELITVHKAEHEYIESTPPIGELTPYQELLGTTSSVNGTHLASLQQVISSLKKEIEENKRFFQESIGAVAREWAEAKKVALKLEATIEQSKKSVRDELEPKINEHVSAMKRLNARLETESAGRKLLIQKYNECSSEVAKLKPRSERLFDAEEKSRSLQKAHDTMEVSLRGLQLKHSQLIKENKIVEEEVVAAKVHIEEKEVHIDNHRRELHVARKSIAEQQLEVSLLSKRLTEIMDRNFKRLNCLENKEIQCDPEVTSIAIQTEFIIPAMSLGINKGRHKFKQSDTHKSPTPLNLLGSQSNEYLYDRKSVEFEKAIDSLRLGPNQQLPPTSFTLSTFSELLCERAVNSRQSALTSPSKRTALTQTLPSLQSKLLN